MQNKIIALLLILIPALSIAQQNRNKKTIPLLCHTWNFNNKIESDIKQMPPAELKEIRSITFLSNKTYIYKTINVVKRGVWKLETKTNQIILKASDEQFLLTIIKLTTNDLILESKENGLSKKIQLYRE